MTHKVFLSKHFVISGIVIFFFLMSVEGKMGPEQTIPSETSKQDVSGIEKGHKLGKSNSIEETQKGFKDINSLTSLQLGLRLAGTVLLGKEHSFAVIVDKKTGKQRLYRLGQSVKGVTILKIGRESILVEKEGMTQVLRVTRGNIIEEGLSKNSTENGPPSIGVSEALPPFEPIVTENGPPFISVSEQLPPFEPIVIGPNPPVFEPLDSEKELYDE